MTRKIAPVLFLITILLSIPGHSQVFHEKFPGVHGMPTAPWKTTTATGPKVYDCAGGPGTNMIVASEYGFFHAIDAGIFPDYAYSVQMARKADFDAVAGMAMGRIPSICNAGDFRSWYVGYRCESGVNTTGSPLFLMDLDKIEIVVPLEELTAVTGGANAGIFAVETGPEQKIYLGVGGTSNQGRKILEVDLSKEPGQRVSIFLDEAQAMAGLPATDTSNVTKVMFDMHFAVDDTGRVFLPLTLVMATPETSEVMGHVIVRRNLDGSITEITEREYGSFDMTSSLEAQFHPALGMQSGLEFDSKTGLLTGSGYGFWVMNPDVPGKSYLAVAPEQIQSLAYSLVGDDWTNCLPMAAPTGSCLAETEYGTFTALMYVYLMFDFDQDLLDFDDDGLTGKQEFARGTDPWELDTDDGGIGDGMEILDFTDPLDSAGDRYFGGLPEKVALVDLFWGSQYEQALEGHGVGPYGAALWDGRLLLGRYDGPVARPPTMDIFSSYDADPVTSNIPTTDGKVKVDAAGNAYHLAVGLTSGDFRVHKTTPAGVTTEPLRQQEIKELVGEAPYPTSWAAEPDGRLWIGYKGGRIIRTGADGKAELVYDALADQAAAGMCDETGFISEFACQVEVVPEVMTYEPMRGLLYVGLNTYTRCSGVSQVMASHTIVAFLPNDSIVRVGSTTKYPVTTIRFGTGEMRDLEPDWKGGFFLLQSHGMDRSLVHFDASWRTTELRTYFGPDFDEDGAPSILNYTNDVIATRSGKVYLLMGKEYAVAPVEYGLIELQDADLYKSAATTAAPEKAGLGPLFVLFLLLAAGGLATSLFNKGKAPPVWLAAVIVILTGCGGGTDQPGDIRESDEQISGDQGNIEDAPVSDNAIQDTNSFDTNIPGVDCTGKDTCDPAAGSVCVDETKHKRCQFGPDGCWVWSRVVECLPEETCVKGNCTACVPWCAPDQECGDDGCGGTCGTCQAPDVCCMDSFCGSCTVDCDGRQCGHDGAGGSCGDCWEGQVCSQGACRVEDSGRCSELADCVNDCEIWNESCLLACQDFLSEESLELAADFWSCAGVYCDHCYEADAAEGCMDDCIFRKCATPFSECAAQGGKYDCKTLYECAFACDPGDQACIEGCYYGAFPSGLETALKFEVCLGEHCDSMPPDADAWDCYATAARGSCQQEFNNCVKGCSDDCTGITCGLNDCLLPCGPPCE